MCAMSVLMHEVIGCVVLSVYFLQVWGQKKDSQDASFPIVHLPKSSFCKIHHNSNTSSFAYIYMYMYLLNVCHAQVIDCVAFCVTLYLFV